MKQFISFHTRFLEIFEFLETYYQYYSKCNSALYHGHGTSWSGKLILSVEMLACKKTPKRIEIILRPGNQSKFSHRNSKAFIPNFVTSHQQRPRGRNIISSIFASDLWIKRQQFRGQRVWPVREAGRLAGPASNQMALFRSVSVLLPFTGFFFSTGHGSGPSGKAAAKRNRGEKFCCVCHPFFFRAHSRKAEFLLSFCDEVTLFPHLAYTIRARMLDVYLCSFTSI